MKLCPTCTTNNPDEATACERCGFVFPIPARTYHYPKDIITRVEDHPPSPRAKLALICGVLAVLSVVFVVFCSPIPGVIAIVLGNRELKSMKKGAYSSKGTTYAHIGVWGGWVSTTIGLMMIGLGATVSWWFFNWFKSTFIY